MLQKELLATTFMTLHLSLKLVEMDVHFGRVCVTAV